MGGGRGRDRQRQEGGRGRIRDGFESRDVVINGQVASAVGSMGRGEMNNERERTQD